MLRLNMFFRFLIWKAQTIIECKKLLDNFDLQVSLSFIAANFTILSSTIKRLETPGLSLESALSSIEALKKKLETIYDRKYIDKLNSALEKNKGFSTLSEICSLLIEHKKLKMSLLRNSQPTI